MKKIMLTLLVTLMIFVPISSSKAKSCGVIVDKGIETPLGANWIQESFPVFWVNSDPYKGLYHMALYGSGLPEDYNGSFKQDIDLVIGRRYSGNVWVKGGTNGGKQLLIIEIEENNGMVTQLASHEGFLSTYTEINFDDFTATDSSGTIRFRFNHNGEEQGTFWYIDEVCLKAKGLGI